ncbi:MAG: potassium channel family protein [Candidatus Sericytochromatia bacterium]
MKQFAVIGLGHFGTSVARTLRHLGHEVLVLDNSPEKIQQAMDEHIATEGMALDSTNLHVLEGLGLQGFDGVVIAIGENLQDSILTALNLMEMGVKHIVAKASTPAHGKILERLSVPSVVYPEHDMGERVARSMVQTNLLDGFDLDPRYSVVELRAGQALVGKSLMQLDLRARYGIYVMAIKNGSQELAIVPRPDIVIQSGDILLVIGENKQLQKFMEATA